MTTNEIQFLANCAVTAYCADLQRQYGWTGICVEIEILVADQLLAIKGQVLSERQLEGIAHAIKECLPVGWSISTGQVTVLKGIEWRSLPRGLTILWREATGNDRRSMSTQLMERDGPVELLCCFSGKMLVRATDGTVGWTEDPLECVVPAPILSLAPATPRCISALLQTYIGVPYLLGGTTQSGIDCSGLVQRVYRDSVGALLPRHSRDQQCWSPPPNRPLGHPGDLVFLGAGDEGSSHVGLLVWDNSEMCVIHASSCRGLVVRDTLGHYLSSASSSTYRTTEATIATYNHQQGQSTLVLKPHVVPRHDYFFRMCQRT